MTSAYPVPLKKLIPMVRDLAAELGEEPSENTVMDRFRVGRPKARQALAALTDTSPGADPASAATHNEPDGRRLHSVPAPAATTTAHDTDDTSPNAPERDESDTGSGEPPASVTLPEASGRSVDPAESMQVTRAADAPAPRTASHRVTTWWGATWRGRWPIVLIALGAFVAIWGGWVELGKLTGFGEITPLPGIADDWTINSAITLPLGMEAYAAQALQVWLSDRTRSGKARAFAKWSALGALLLGAGGQVAYHLMAANGMTVAPWWITTVVSCLPVIVLGFGAALLHLTTRNEDDPA